MAASGTRQLPQKVDQRISNEMTSLATLHLSKMKKLQIYIKNLEKSRDHLNFVQEELQDPTLAIPRDTLCQLVQVGVTELGKCVTVNHYLNSMFDNMFKELECSLLRKTEMIFANAEECQHLKQERNAILETLKQKHDNMKKLKIAAERRDAELENLREYKEVASIKLLVLEQKFLQVRRELETKEQEKKDMDSKFESQNGVLKRVNSMNEHLSRTLAQNATVIEQITKDMQNQTMHIQELHSVHASKEVVIEQVQDELKQCQKRIEQLEMNNWELVNSLTDTTRQYQVNIDRTSRLQGNNSLLKDKVVLLEANKEKLVLDLRNTSQRLDESKQLLRHIRNEKRKST